MSREKPKDWDELLDVAEKVPCTFCRAPIGRQCRTASDVVCEPHDVRVTASEFWDNHFAYADVARLEDCQSGVPCVLAARP